MTSLKPTIASILWNSIGKVLEYVLLYAMSILVARGLGLYQNGTYATLMSLTQVLLVLSSMGLETALNKHIPQIDEPHAGGGTRYLLIRAIFLRVIIFVLGAAVLRYGLEIFLKSPAAELRDYLLVLFAYAASRALIPLFAIVLTARYRTDIVAAVNVGARLVEIGAVLFMAQEGLTIQGLLLLFSVTGLGQIACYVLIARHVFLGSTSPQPVRPFVTFGAIFWVNAIVDYFLGRHGDIFFLTSITGDPTAASLYDVAYSVVQLASLALTVGFGGVTFATFASLAVSSPEGMDRFYEFLVRLISCLTIPLYAFLVFHSDSLVKGFYSTAFAGAAALVQGIAWFRITARLFGGGENTEYLLARGFPGRVSTFGVFAAIINITLDLSLIPIFGAGGAVIASGVANVFVNSAGYFLVRRRSPIHLQVVTWAKVTGVSLLLSWGLSILMPVQDLVHVPITGGVLVGGVVVALFILKPFTATDVEMLQAFSPFAASSVRLFARRAHGG